MADSQLQQLVKAMRTEAMREAFPIDTPVYEAAGLDPLAPILFTGNLKSSICFFARDLGRDEVIAQQPLYGAAGRLVRSGVHRAYFGQAATDSESLQKAAEQVLLTNTVPYKPPGNKAYSQKVKNRFRPFIEKFLLRHWTGTHIITLGNEALKWFTFYDKTLKDFVASADKFSEVRKIVIKNTDEGESCSREVTLAPLPHPSPLNQKYYSLFPDMLQQRLREIRNVN